MGYALQSMLKIRTMREDKSQTALAQARSAKVQAEKVLEQKTQAVIEYEVSKEERRDRVFASVMGKSVTRDDLDNARLAVAQIDEEGLLLVEAEHRAKELVEKREAEVEQARKVYVCAVKEMSKIVEHRRIWEEEARKQEEITADREMEDFVSRKAEI